MKYLTANNLFENSWFKQLVNWFKQRICEYIILYSQYHNREIACTKVEAQYTGISTKILNYQTNYHRQSCDTS